MISGYFAHMMEMLMWSGAYVVAVILHELGHVVAAKAFGVRIRRAFLFLDANRRSLFETKVGKTVVGIGWLPLGGYVELAGLERMRDGIGRLLMPPRPWEFPGRPTYQQALIMLAGVIVNVATTLLLAYSSLLSWTELMHVSVWYGLLQIFPHGESDGALLARVMTDGGVWEQPLKFVLGMLVIWGAVVLWQW